MSDSDADSVGSANLLDCDTENEPLLDEFNLTEIGKLTETRHDQIVQSMFDANLQFSQLFSLQPIVSVEKLNDTGCSPSGSGTMSTRRILPTLHSSLPVATTTHKGNSTAIENSSTTQPSLSLFEFESDDEESLAPIVSKIVEQIQVETASPPKGRSYLTGNFFKPDNTECFAKRKRCRPRKTSKLVKTNEIECEKTHLCCSPSGSGVRSKRRILPTLHSSLPVTTTNRKGNSTANQHSSVTQLNLSPFQSESDDEDSLAPEINKVVEQTDIEEADPPKLKWKNDPTGNSFKPENTEWKCKLIAPPCNYDPLKSHPIQNFYAFFTPEMFELLAKETNRHSQLNRKNDKTRREDGPSTNQRDHIQRPFTILGVSINVTTVEMEIFIGILLHMSLFPTTNMQDYWDTGGLYTSVVNFMPRKRFEEINRNFHLNKLNDRLFKVRTPFDHIKSVCNSLPQSEYHYVSEKSVSYAGQNTKMLVDCDPTGIVQNFILHNHQQSEHFDCIYELIGHLQPRRNYKLVLDSSFASVDLVRSLQSRGFHTVAQINSDQINGAAEVLPPEIEMVQLGKGVLDAAVSEDGNLIVVRWVNNEAAVVNFISTFAGVAPITFASENDSDSTETSAIPDVVQKYNEAKCNVVLTETFNLSAHFEQHSDGRHTNILHFLLGVAVVNSWLLERRWKRQIANDQDCADVDNRQLPEISLFDYTYAIAEALLKYKKIPPTLVDYKGKPKRKRGRPEKHPEFLKPKAIEFELRSENPEEDTCVVASSKITVSKGTQTRKRWLEAATAENVNQTIQKDMTADPSWGHFPIYPQILYGVKHRRLSQGRCAKCSAKASVACAKCQVRLCFTTERNCFTSFHNPNYICTKPIRNAKPERKADLDSDEEDYLDEPGTSNQPNNSESSTFFRLDQIGHLPAFNDDGSSKPAKDHKFVLHKCKQCRFKSNDTVRCVKCDVWLCFLSSRNCFFSYHTE